MKLKKFIKSETGKNIGLLLLLAFIYLLTYTTTNHFSLWGPWQLSMFNVEKNIPFIPWSVSIYLSVYLLIIIALIIIPKNKFRSAIYGMFGIMIIHGLFFLIIPTTYPRPNFPLDISAINYYLYKFLIATDLPQNCFPSQHVSMCIFISLFIYFINKKIGTIFLIWSLLIIISTLTLKQHYILDVLGGFILAILANVILQRRNLQSSLFSK